MLTKVSAGVLNIDDLYGFRNRIINGGMVIDQRNAGASVSVSSGNTYGVDRWFAFPTSPAAFTMQQDSSAPAGFSNSVKITVTTNDSSLAASDFNSFRHIIEGLNVADFDWGTANAKTVTLSFWVRSSLTGTFGVAIRNSAVNRSYVSTYTISTADTWEQKTITLPGDTTGTWLKNNSQGIRLDWSLGCGSDFQGTAGSWTATNDTTTSSETSVVGTNGATWFITGVQLEVGSVATPFERRPFGTELALCERYYQVINTSIAIATNTTTVRCFFNLRTYMRTEPTMSQTGIYRANYPGVGTTDQSSVNVAVETGYDAAYGLNADFGNFSGLTAQRVYMFIPANDPPNQITFSAEL